MKNPCRECIIRPLCNCKCDKLEDYSEKCLQIITITLFSLIEGLIIFGCISSFLFDKTLGYIVLAFIFILNISLFYIITFHDRDFKIWQKIILIFLSFSIVFAQAILYTFDIKKLVYFKLKDLKERHENFYENFK